MSGLFHARVAATTEMSAGIGLAVGLFTPIPAAGWECNLIPAVAAVAVATIGAGTFSLDYAIFHTTNFYDYLHGWWGLLISVALGLAGGIGQLVIFYRPLTKADSSSRAPSDVAVSPANHLARPATPKRG